MQTSKTKSGTNAEKFRLFASTELVSIILKFPTKIVDQKASQGNSQFSSVTQLCPTLCDPMNYSMPGLPVHHQLPEFTQTHVHRVSDAIQPSHPLSYPSPSAPNPFQVFPNESTLLMRWQKYWSFSFSISLSNEHPGFIG